VTPTITLTDTPDAQMRSAILRPLIRFNEQRMGRPEDHRLLAVLLSDPTTGETIGGLWAATLLAQLHVDLLFVPESLRGTGIGRQLMGDGETEAIRRGCLGAWLDTYSFQARGFYERLGYSVFGTIENHPPGHSRFFMRKDLVTARDGRARASGRRPGIAASMR
jgi:GNAT superfamily N-acetyltransferase